MNDDEIDFTDDMVLVDDIHVKNNNIVFEDNTDLNYIQKVLSKYKPGIYKQDNAPACMRGIFLLPQLLFSDNVEWFKYHYNNMDYNFINDYHTKTPHTLQADYNMPFVCNATPVYHINSLMSVACKYGAINCMKFLLSKCRLFDEESVLYCVNSKKNSLLCLKYAIENLAPYNSFALNSAIYANNYECVRYLLDNKYTFDETTIHNIVSNNFFKAIEIMYEYGYELTTSHLYIVIQKDHIEIIKILGDRGYKYNAYHMFIAMRNKSHKCMEYFDIIRDNSNLPGSFLLCI